MVSAKWIIQLHMIIYSFRRRQWFNRIRNIVRIGYWRTYESYCFLSKRRIYIAATCWKSLFDLVCLFIIFYQPFSLFFWMKTSSYSRLLLVWTIFSLRGKKKMWALRFSTQNFPRLAISMTHSQQISGKHVCMMFSEQIDFPRHTSARLFVSSWLSFMKLIVFSDELRIKLFSI